MCAPELAAPAIAAAVALAAPAAGTGGTLVGALAAGLGRRRRAAADADGPDARCSRSGSPSSASGCANRRRRGRRRVSPLSWNGYVDFGFFVPLGNGGVGWVRDDGHTRSSRSTRNYAWVFLGDILGTPINTRGEAADLGDAPGLTVPRYDGINSDGAASFILNEINLRPRYQLSDNAIMRASINFVPRTGSDFALGDTVDADLAELEYLLTKDGKTSVFAGKILPVFGIEYKERKSDQRFGITPSLIARYTVGSQLGLKIRSKLLDDWLVLAGSVTNGSSTIEMFHFYNETDTNNFKTLNGRAAVSIPVGRLYRRDDRLELGVSGE